MPELGEEGAPKLEGPHTRIIKSVKRLLHREERRTAPKEEPLSLGDQILLKAQIPPVPSYFAGLPASTEDLNGERLTQVYMELEKRVDPQAAVNFARMVQELPSLAGTEFVKSVKALERNNWIYDPETLGTTKLTLEDIKNEADVMASMLGGAAASLRHESDQTGEIKDQFKRSLQEHGITIPNVQTIEGNKAKP